MKVKKLLTLTFVFAIIVFFYSCSNKNELEILFPLGISIEDILEDKEIDLYENSYNFLSEEEVKEGLLKMYKVDNDGTGAVHKEDNFGDTNNLEKVEALKIINYEKNNVLYDNVLLFFKNNKLIQVYAEVKNYIDDNRLKLQMRGFKNPKEKVFEQIYYKEELIFITDTYDTETSTYDVDRKKFVETGKITQDTSRYDALQYKCRKTYFEIETRRKHRTYFTYYTKKVLPLFGVDY